MVEEKIGLVIDLIDKNKGLGVKELCKGQLLILEQFVECMSQGVLDYFVLFQVIFIIQIGIEFLQYDDWYMLYQGDLNCYCVYEQGLFDEFGNVFGRFVFNIIFGIIGNIVVVFDFINDEEMGNELIWVMNEVKCGVNDMLFIYCKDFGKLLDIGDFVWWFENGFVFVGFVVEFLVFGVVIFKIFRVSKLLVWFGKFFGGVKIRVFGEGLVNNYLFNNVEGVIIVMDVYDQVLLDQLILEFKCKKIVFDVVVYVLNMNWVNMFFNVSFIMVFLKLLWYSWGIIKDFIIKVVMKVMVGESVQEYVEEVINYLLVEEGKCYVSVFVKGEDYEMLLENIVKDIFFMEGIEVGLLGVVGGFL